MKKTVSYTHLDVYKRQAFEAVQRMALRRRGNGGREGGRREHDCQGINPGRINSGRINPGRFPEPGATGEFNGSSKRILICMAGITGVSALAFVFEAVKLGFIPMFSYGVPHAYSYFHVSGVHYFKMCIRDRDGAAGPAVLV